MIDVVEVNVIVIVRFQVVDDGQFALGPLYTDYKEMTQDFIRNAVEAAAIVNNVSSMK